jgi:hypothetical protein
VLHRLHGSALRDRKLSVSLCVFRAPLQQGTIVVSGSDQIGFD